MSLIGLRDRNGYFGCSPCLAPLHPRAACRGRSWGAHGLARLNQARAPFLGEAAVLGLC